VYPSSFIDRRQVRRIPNALPRSKALKHGHCRGKTSSIGADRGDDGIWIYRLAGSFIIFKIMQIASVYLICFSSVKLVIIVRILPDIFFSDG
jgi:hypothetical protein